MHAANVLMAGAGVRLFILIVRGGFDGDWWTSSFWRDDGVYGDESDWDSDLTLDRQAREILAVRPDAQFLVRWADQTPKRWVDRHPDQMQAHEDGRLTREASLASELHSEGLAEMSRRIIAYCKLRPWADRVIGYMYFPMGEGTTLLSIEGGLFDQSPVMHQAFGQAVPTDSQWRRVRATWKHWPDPVHTHIYRKYFDLQRNLFFGTCAGSSPRSARPRANTSSSASTP